MIPAKTFSIGNFIKTTVGAAVIAAVPLGAQAQTYACDLHYFSSPDSDPRDAHLIFDARNEDNMQLALFSDIVEDLKFTCEYVAFVDGVECYSYYASGTPLQFNFYKNQPEAGDPATFVALAMSFLDTYDGAAFSTPDFESRRFAVQMYKIIGCS